MKTRIFNLIIIDESGSMQSIKKPTIDSVNETIQSVRAAQKQYEDQEHFVSLVSFNDNVKVINECAPVAEIQELNDETYQPNCCTALYDAIGISVNALRQKVEKDDKVLVTIVTDGYENASREWTGKAVKELIEEMRQKGWVFAYIGANHDVEAAATTISITNTMVFEASDEGVKEMRQKEINSRNFWYSRIHDGVADAEEDNKSFFKKMKDLF